jgi:uncharacterized protein involved in type VI secretion and phage assembly
MNNDETDVKARKIYGKYRGIVATNIDPLQMGRLMVQVPDIMGNNKCAWAMPAAPVAGQQMGMYALPPVGSGVWVEFEQGDVDYPIWVGCWYGSSSEVPKLALLAPPGMQNIALQTMGQNTVLLTDVSSPAGGIVLKSAGGAIITVNDLGIEISNGKGAVISLKGPSVSINVNGLIIT